MGTTSWFERLYTNFVGRDLAYFGGGALVVGVSVVAWTGDLQALDIPWSSLKGLFTLAGCYLLGLSLSEAGHISGCLVKTYWRTPRPSEQCDRPEWTKRNMTELDAVERTAHERLRQDLERTVVLMHLGSVLITATGASLVSLLTISAVRGTRNPSMWIGCGNVVFLAVPLVALFGFSFRYFLRKQEDAAQQFAALVPDAVGRAPASGATLHGV